MKNFEKGEIVVAHSEYDRRECDMQMMVTGIGRKYITCNVMYNGDLSSNTVQFDVETHRIKDNRYGSYILYHSIEEYKEKEKTEQLKRELFYKLSRESFSLAELQLLDEIHRVGIDEWKRRNLKQE